MFLGLDSWNEGLYDNTDVGDYDDYNWNQLPLEIKEAAGVLGYTQSKWDSSQETSITTKSWDELTEAQQTAAWKLGYSRSSWDGRRKRLK